mgnify:CR=1 FL=1
MTADEKRAYCEAKGYSIEYADYWIRHPMCECCHLFYSEAPHHLVTRGGGGGDEDSNLLALCAGHHRTIHNVGDLQLGRLIGGVVQAKIMAAKHA